tara:strand:+ start:4963 stop:5208 length:246 start_codon:yes stop_codon:yes gene_type:complete
MNNKQKVLFNKEETEKVSYDFSVDSIVSVEAPIGTDPDVLWEQAFNQLYDRVMQRDLNFRFEEIFDKETGAYDKDWEGYSR